jgi:hypothetical protein
MANIKRANTSGITKSGVAIPDVPDAPTIGAATNVGTSRAYNNGSATVAFTAAATGGTATSFTATSTPGSLTATGAGSPLTVTGLQAGTSYTFAVTGTNASGTTPASSATSSITATTVPQAPTIGTLLTAVLDTTVSLYHLQQVLLVVLLSQVTSNRCNHLLLDCFWYSSPLSLTGLTAGVKHTFYFTATNANGTLQHLAVLQTVITPYTQKLFTTLQVEHLHHQIIQQLMMYMFLVVEVG